MTVTIGMPYFGAPDLLGKAVRSVLAQTVRDIRLVVVGDGERPVLSGIHDSRLEVYVLPENRGTYFAHQLILSATPDAWYAPHDADDWSEPDHLERLLACDVPAVGTGSIWLHQGGVVRIYRGTPERKAVFHVGLFDAARLRSVGGYNPAERIGQDTVALRLLRTTGPYLRLDLRSPTYHRIRHPGSLTTAAETNHRSAARNAVKRRNRALYAAIAGMEPATIRAYREALVPPRTADDLVRHVDRLSAKLGKAVAA